MLHAILKTDLTAAQKAQDARLLGVLRLVLSELSYAVVDKTGDGLLRDEEVTLVLQKEAKKRKDAIEIFEKAGDKARTEQEQYELGVIEKYLPAMMGEDEVLKVIEETAGETGLRGGKLMGAVMGKLRGKVDGGVVNRLVSEKFA